MNDVASLQMERDRLRAEVDGLRQAYTEATGRMSGLIGYAVKECESLRAELAEVRRLLLPHPDAKAGEDAGCGCDLHTAVTAAAWAAAEMMRLEAEVRRMRAEVEEATAVARTLVTLFPDLPELLGGRHRQPAFELMVDAKRVVENNGGNQ